MREEADRPNNTTDAADGNDVAEVADPGGERSPIDATAMLDLVLGPVVNAAEVLHHATRKRAVPRAIALPGNYLQFTDEDGEQLLALDTPKVRIGRSSSADIQLEDIRVSRRHAIISSGDGQVRILDDGSSTGTHVNGVSVLAAELNDGDVIRLGSVMFTFVVVR